YGIVLAGWSSGSKYPLLGAVRSTSQIISYEVGMGLAIVALVMYAGTVNMAGIVARQEHLWNVIPQAPAFVIYLIAALAEVNRPPFDLPEAETELVAGYQTEYSGIKFAFFYLAEYLNTVTVSAIAVTLFLGGPRGPWISDVPALGIVWFLLKVFAIVYFYIWVRATLPRFRYDRLMSFGWKFLIPFGLVWILFTGAVVVLPDKYGKGQFLKWAAIVIAVLLIVTSVWPTRKRDTEAARAPAKEAA
ncbi:MAG TPA: NADH-quinone oxidoreductase subunit H, partial [Actinomycetota bacterium]|nr:NADH-quinone oxidoreductase subunit H [Actinomycetota bacterium]